MKSDTVKKIPLETGLWTADCKEEDTRLLASRCRSCGELFFPRLKRSECLHCRAINLEDVKLTRRGTIRSVSTVMIPPAGGFYKGPMPYAYGLVDLAEGIMIKSIIISGNPNELEPGMDVELVIEKLYSDESGNDIVTYMFKPVHD